MGVHVEWVDAESVKVAVVRPSEIEDAYGTRNERHALVLSGDDEVVIEGTPAELTALVRRLLASLRSADGEPTTG